MPKISIVTSTYNRPEKLKAAIQSVIDQSYEDWELLVVADGPQPEAKAVVTAFKNPKVLFQELPEHFGNDTKPKNFGILCSTGEYVAFLDDDNTFRPDHLAVLINAIEKEPELDGVYGDRWTFVDGKDGKLGTHGDWNPTQLFGQNYIDISDVLVKKSCLMDMGGFDERYKKFIDWNLWLRMAKARKKMKRIPLIITDYYIDDTSKSRRHEDSKGEHIPAWHPFSCETRLDYLGKRVQPKIAIFSLTYDRLDLTQECFGSLYRTAGYPFDHFIVDNGSSDSTPDYLQNLINPNGTVFVHLNPDNRGISIASNQALDSIKNESLDRPYDIIMKVDNDCYFKNENWLQVLVKIWNVWPTIALSLYVEGLKDNPGGAPRVEYMEIADELVGMTNHLGGICHFVDASAYKDFRWDEESFLHGVQDMEFSQYLQFNGYFMGYLENYYCEHRYGTEGQHKRYESYFERRKLEKKTRYEKNG